MNWLKELMEKAMMMSIDGGGGTADGADTDAGGGGAVQTDAMGDQNAPAGGAPPEGGGAGGGAEEPYSVQYGDQTFTEAQIIEAIESHQNKSTWEGELHQRGADLNILQASMERARQEHMGGPQTPQSPGAANPLELSGEQLRDMMLDDADGFKRALGEYVNNAVSGAVQQQVGEMDSRNTAQTHFTGKHGDFNEVLQSSEFAAFYNGLPMDAHGQPIYNEVNAFYEFKNQMLEQKLQAAESAGFKSGEENARKNLDARNRLKVLRGGGGMAPSQGQAPSVQSMSHGEFLNDATKMLERMRSGGNSGG